MESGHWIIDDERHTHDITGWGTMPTATVARPPAEDERWYEHPYVAFALFILYCTAWALPGAAAVMALIALAPVWVAVPGVVVALGVVIAGPIAGVEWLSRRRS